jgi:GNAT superfamily N-acetyltransferase
VIQDILILKGYQRRGYGKKLINEILNKYSHVRMKVLLTDDTEKTKVFYDSVGFKKASEVGTVCYLNHQ